MSGAPVVRSLKIPVLKIGMSSSCLGVVPFCLPPLRRSISSVKSATINGKPAGHPSIVRPTHAPCDSPNICTLNKVPNLFMLQSSILQGKKFILYPLLPPIVVNQ